MILLEKTIHEFPRLDDNVKSLENDSSVTNNNTMICQGFVLSQVRLEYHCDIIGENYSQVSKVGR